MLFISVDDFYSKVSAIPAMNRQEEIECAAQMKAGDALARERLIQGYLPMVAGCIKRAPAHVQSLGLIMSCLQMLEKAVDSFDFLQDSESFSHRLNWVLRQTVVKYMVNLEIFLRP